VKLYTVMFLRSYRFENLARHDVEPETDTYFAHVEASGYTDAIKAGRQQVFEADCRDFGKRTMQEMGFGPDEETYDFLGLFAGHIEPVLHAWQHHN
jgi:hypothetical protein